MFKKSEVRVEIKKKGRSTPARVDQSRPLTHHKLQDYPLLTLYLVFMVFAIVQAEKTCFRNQFNFVGFGEKIKDLEICTGTLVFLTLSIYAIQFILIFCLTMSEQFPYQIQDVLGF